MSILRELIKLQENADDIKVVKSNEPLELSDIVEYFPSKHTAVLDKLWGTERLTWHGKKFFDANNLGDVYVEAEDAVDAVIGDVSIDAGITLSPVYRSNLPELDFDPDTIEWQSKIGKNDKQEVYLGYDPKTDKLYMGFDAWIDEQDYNDAFDEQFERIVGERFDDENKVHEAIAEETWKKYTKSKQSFYGIIFEISYDEGSNSIDEALELPQFTNPGGFYGGDCYGEFKRQYPNVIDLRLD
jgi:hypothetical protein